MEIFDLELGPFGAPGFGLVDRLDMTGHGPGKVDPHLNVDLVKPNGDVLGLDGPADFRDLIHSQLPGFNGMQHGW